jgi:acetyl-CoA carboxylase carboxyltransferase component
MRKFEFKKTYEEVEIAGKVYKIEFNDDKIREYQEKFLSFEADVQEFLNVDETKLTKEERWEHFEKGKQLARNVIDTLLGEGSFDELYEKSGRSIANMYDLIWYLAGIVNERNARNKEEKRQQYVKPKRHVNRK